MGGSYTFTQVSMKFVLMRSIAGYVTNKNGEKTGNIFRKSCITIFRRNSKQLLKTTSYKIIRIFIIISLHLGQIIKEGGLL